MSVFADKSKQIKAIDVNRILRVILKESNTTKFVLDLNRKDQLFIEGIQSDGSFLESSNTTEGVYSHATIELTQEERGSISFTYAGVTKDKKAGERYMLYDTGEWYRSFKLVINNKDFEIKANTNIGDGNTNVFQEYGENVVGLTEKSICKLTDYIRERVIQEVKREATR